MKRVIKEAKRGLPGPIKPPKGVKQWYTLRTHSWYTPRTHPEVYPASLPHPEVYRPPYRTLRYNPGMYHLGIIRVCTTWVYAGYVPPGYTTVYTPWVHLPTFQCTCRQCGQRRWCRPCREEALGSTLRLITERGPPCGFNLLKVLKVL